MKYQWEGLDILAPLTFKSNQTVWTVEKLDKSIDRLSHPSQRWDLSFAVKSNEGENFAFRALTGDFSVASFMPMPSLLRSDHKSSLNGRPAVGAIKLESTAAAGVSTVTIKNSVATSFAVGVGTFVQFSNHNKVYVMTSDRTFPASTAATTMNFFPKLRVSVPANTTVKFYDEVTYHYYLDTNNLQGITYVDGQLFGIDNVSLWEAL